MVRVLSYVLQIEDSQIIEIPKHSVILYATAKKDEGFIRVYALVDSANTEIDKYQFEVMGTGHSRDNLNGFHFLGTVMKAEGRLVFHVFYKKL